MTDAGYTLAETLAALFIVGLAVTGLTTGLEVIGHQQARTAAIVGDTEALRAGQAAMERALSGCGPFRSNEPETFAGGPRNFQFNCAEAQPRAVELASAAAGETITVTEGGRSRVFALPVKSTLGFRYRGGFEAGDIWPQPRPERQALRTISVVAADNAGQPAVLAARVWRAQPADCQFDAILQDCR